MDPYRSQDKSYRKIQTSQKTNQTKYRTTTTIFLQGFKLKRPPLYTKSPQKQNLADDWQRPLSPKPTKTAVCETELTTQKLQQSTLGTQPEDLYELLHDAPDNCFPHQPTHPKIDPTPEIHHTSKNHVTIKTSCNNEKQPILDEDLPYLPISTSLTLKRKRHMKNARHG